MNSLAPTLQKFFTSYLAGQKGASAHTISAYRDTWRLLLKYIYQHKHVRVDQVDFTDLDAETITLFLTYLEDDRGNSPATRNARLAAIHALFAYAAYDQIQHADLIAKVMAIAPKRAAKPDIGYLTDPEVHALLAAPDLTTWVGRRDQVIIATLISTGLRISELIGTCWADAQLDSPTYLRCRGKGRKDRTTPLDSSVVKMLGVWQEETQPSTPHAPIFTAQGSQQPITAAAVTKRLAVHTQNATKKCPTLHTKSVTPHVLRHTCAMRLLAAGIDAATISLWLGHESIDSTAPYLHADLAIKQRALDRTAPPATKTGRYKPAQGLLKFLDSL